MILLCYFFLVYSLTSCLHSIEEIKRLYSMTLVYDLNESDDITLLRAEIKNSFDKTQRKWQATAHSFTSGLKGNHQRTAHNTSFTSMDVGVLFEDALSKLVSTGCSSISISIRLRFASSIFLASVWDVQNAMQGPFTISNGKRRELATNLAASIDNWSHLVNNKVNKITIRRRKVRAELLIEICVNMAS